MNNNYYEILKRIIISYDSDDDLEFLAAMHNARCILGLRLEEPDNTEEIEALIANGYDEFEVIK